MKWPSIKIDSEREQIIQDLLGTGLVSDKQRMAVVRLHQLFAAAEERGIREAWDARKDYGLDGDSDEGLASLLLSRKQKEGVKE